MGRPRPRRHTLQGRGATICLRLWARKLYLSGSNDFRAVWRGWLKGALFKYGIGIIKEDGEQMPGVFFLKNRKIVRAFRHRTIADEPDYLKLVGAG